MKRNFLRNVWFVFDYAAYSLEVQSVSKIDGAVVSKFDAAYSLEVGDLLLTGSSSAPLIGPGAKMAERQILKQRQFLKSTGSMLFA